MAGRGWHMAKTIKKWSELEKAVGKLAEDKVRERLQTKVCSNCGAVGKFDGVDVNLVKCAECGQEISIQFK